MSGALVQAYVDVRQSRVDCNGNQWPFELDCRSGTVSLTLGKRQIRLRRVSWREKRTLARFSTFGEEFLKQEFVRVALAENETLPDDASEREALWALARWLNAPDGQSGLPLDQRLLASVTFDLCRAMHFAPAVFEDMEAVEVELLWQAARGEQPRAAEESAGTRILVVPDHEPEPSDPGEFTEARTLGNCASATQVKAAQKKMVLQQNESSKDTASAAHMSESPLDRVKVGPILRRLDETSVKAAENRFRVFLESGWQKSAAGQVRRLNRRSGLQAQAIAESHDPDRAAVPLMPSHSVSPRASSLELAAHKSHSKISAAIEPFGLRNDEPPPAAIVTSANPAESSPRWDAAARQEPYADELTPDEWFDEFALRLREAARILGIDVET